MAVFWGLAAALGWGLGDFLVRLAGRGEGVYRTMLYGQLAGLALLTAYLALVGGDTLVLARGAGPAAWAAALGAVPLLLGATFCLFRGLTIGTIALVAPVTASYGAVTAGLSALAGEPIGAVMGLGMALCVLGVALTSSPGLAGRGRARAAPLRGLGWAAAAALGYGAGFWMQGRWAVAGLGPLLPVWVYYAVGVAVLATIGAARGSIVLPGRGRRLLLLGTGVIGVGAYLAFGLGLATGEVAVVTVISSLASGVTVLLGCTLLRERLTRRQWAGAAAILAGIVLIHAGR